MTRAQCLEEFTRGDTGRFYSKVSIGDIPNEWTPSFIYAEPIDPCHLWTGAKDRDGYGHINIGGITMMAHRVSLNLSGRPIPEGLEVDHLCRVRCCVNPAHLEIVTRAENWERGRSLSRLNRDKTHCVNGHKFTPSNTYMDGTGRRCRSCRQLVSTRHTHEYKRNPRIEVSGSQIVEMVRAMNWSEAGRRTGTPDNTLRKRAYKVAISRAYEMRTTSDFEEAFRRSGFPPRMRTLFRRALRSCGWSV